MNESVLIPFVQKQYPYGDSDFQVKAITEKDFSKEF
jgi:hypothetical protein